MIVFSRGEPSDIQEIDGRLVDVFVNEQIRRCATFLYEDIPNEVTGAVEKVAVGTAFFVSKALDDFEDCDIHYANHFPENYFIYVITARHVITDSESDTIYIRLNRDKYTRKGIEECKRHGMFKDVPTRVDDWVSHPQENSTDVAVYQLKLPIGRFDIRWMPFPTLLLDAHEARLKIGSGDEVFFVGLFSGHSGMERVEPVVKFGNVSLMLPGEKVQIYLNASDRDEQKLTPIDAFLIEARSWGGHSGSPVFMYLPPLTERERYVPPEEHSQYTWRFEQLPFILGLVHGQYEDTIKEVGQRQLVNAGIAIVIPADKIRETIMRKEFADEREKLLKKSQHKRAKDAPRPVASSVSTDNNFTESDFMRALKKSSRKVSEDEVKDSETSE